MKGGSCFASNDIMVLCFDQIDSQQCRRGTNPTGQFTEVQKSKFDHTLIRMSASNGN